MKFWEIFSKTIFSFLAGKSLRKIRENSIEITLARSVQLIDAQVIDEIKAYIRSMQTIDGGFADRGGNSDLYYSLFGCYIAEALEMDEVRPLLKDYLTNVIKSENLSGVYLKCALILYVKLFGQKYIPSPLLNDDNMPEQYSDFINMLAFYYTDDYMSLLSAKRFLKAANKSVEMPCSVTSAQLILDDSLGKKVEEPWKMLEAYYRNGSFSAFSKTPKGDLLSTGVALYALRFISSKLNIIKPDCLIYIDSLYSEGGFCATSADPVPDVEYTFYGLLALGSLSD